MSTKEFSANRLKWVDSIRGIAIVLMTIDHIHYFILRQHYSEFWGRELPKYANMASGVMRYLSHLCAPLFFVCLGISVGIVCTKKTTGVHKYFWLKALKLILLELFIVNIIWAVSGNWDFYGEVAYPGKGQNMLHFGVLSCLGLTSVIAHYMVKMKNRELMAISAVCFILPQIAIGLVPSVDYAVNPVIRLLLVPGTTGIMGVLYPVIPWLGYVCIGLLLFNIREDKKLKMKLSVLCLTSTIALLLFVYVGNSVMIKYPLNFTYLFYTLIFISILVLIRGSIVDHVGSIFAMFGRKSLLMYVAHLVIYFVVGIILRNYNICYCVAGTIWIASLVILYLICKIKWLRL